MPTLHDELVNSLGNWRNYLPQCWLNVLNTAELDFSQIDSGENFDVDHPIFPTLQGDCIHGDCVHVFRAFDQLTPANVKIVLIGEDPYPNRCQATGRAFEQGDLLVWVPSTGSNQPVHCAMSLQSIVQQLATFHTGCPAYSASRGGWDAFKSDYRQGRLNNFPTPSAVFDQWQSEGILMLNTALTFTKKSQQRYHAALWRPFIRSILSHLACLQTAPVFLCFGNKAWNILGQHVQTTLICRDLVVRRKHPRVKHMFLEGRNVFEDANAKLSAAGRCGVNFCPDVA